MVVYIEQENGKYRLAVNSEDGIETTSNGQYSLAIEVYPSSGSANINMWSGDWSFFTSHLTTSGHTWTAGTDDMCVSDEATIPNAISVGAYVSKKSWKASSGTTYSSNVYTMGDIAYFSSYATADQSPTGLAYPWISAPGARLAAGVNHYHTASVDSYSYYGSKYNTDLVVNNSNYPYAMMEGTSMATPVAAGIVALWLQASMDENAQHKNLTVNDVKDIMEATAINDSYTNGANATHFGKGKIDALAGIQYILGSSTSPVIKATPTNIDFADKNPYATRSYTKTLNVKGFNLEGDITAALTDANGVYTLSQTSITQDAAADGVDITITYAPTAAGTHEATITLTSSNATDVVVNLTATAKAATPTIIADPETLTFKAGLNEQKSLTFDVLTEFLTGDITVTLADLNSVFSIDKTTITKEASEEGATVTVTFNSAAAGTFTGTVTLSSVGAENVVVNLSAMSSLTSDETIDFTEQGYSNAAEVTSVEGDDCTVTFDKGTNSNAPKYYDTGNAIRVYGGNTMTIASATKTIAKIELTFGSGDGSNTITTDVESYSDGTWTGSASSVTFTVGGTSGNRRIQKVKVTYEGGGTTPVTKQDVTMTFSAATATATIGEEFTEPTLSTTPEGLTLSYSSSTPTVATVNESTGKVTLVAAGTTTITATFAGDETYNGRSASYTLTVSEASGGDDPTPSGNEFALVTSASDFEEGDYIIVYDGAAMNTTVTSNRLQYTAVTPSNNVITTDNAAIIWHIAPNGDYYTIYNARESKYAASNGTKNQAQLLASGTDDKSLWSVTAGSTFEFVNKYNAAKSVNANLRRNGDYGFACYATGTGGALSLYKRTSGSSGGGGDDPDPDDPDPDDPTTDEDYYQPADGKKGEALKTAMCGIIYNRTEKDYDDLWEAYYTTDVDSDGKIWDMYSNKTKYTPVLKGSTYSQEGDCYNREHAFPQSWFGGGMPAKSDLHHVYPTDGYVNGMRSNNPYGETTGDKYKSANDFSKLGACTYPGYSGKVFEPNDEYKGDFARTYFYMVTCYEEQLLTWYTNNSNDTEVDEVLDGTTYPALQTWQLNMLMEWAKNDPVSEKEINRNNAVYAIQKNRNPFIDYPGLEEYIWGSMTTTAFSYDNYVQPVYKQNVTMAFSAATATATLDEKFTEPTLTTDPEDLTVTYSSSEPTVATVDENTGKVTLVAAGTTVITATFAGNVDYNTGSASYTLTVSESSSQEEGTLLYEGLTGYSSDGDSGTELTTSSTYFDYNGWTTVSRVYPGGTSNAKEKGGCLKFGTGSATGKLETKSINLTGSGTLTFYLKKYGSDTGKLNLTVTGAKANKTQFTPSDTWSLCTVNLTEATGSVVITFATSSKRAYVDEITLTDGSTPIVKEDVTMSFDPETAEATIGESFTEPTLTTDPDDLTVTYSSSDESVATVDENTGKVTLVAAGETTITATFAGNDYYNENSASYTLTVSESTTPVVGSGKYEKVTDASTLKAGDKILIAYINEDEETQVVLSTTQNTNNRAAASITVNADGTLSPDDNAQFITLEKDGDNYLFNVGTDGYLYAASSSKNWLMTEKTADANAKAAISISEGDATIEFQGSNSRKYLRYNENSGSPIFSCYASTSTVVTLPQIYREVNTTPAVLIGDANGDGQVTITDAVAIVDYILGNEPENFNKAAANVSGDVDDEGEPIVNITDAVGVVDIILNQE